jgi:energy-coupling factor transporter ATP-binding protein EcfA2
LVAVPSILDEILEWAQTRPLWQQDALRRLVMSGQVDDEAIRNYAVACVDEQVSGLEALAQMHLRSIGGERRTVRVAAIRDGQNVNALMDGCVLTFAPVGLTIVYGDNGSGKSGYARVLKAVTRTRASEQVRSDIFREQGLVPEATIEYCVEDDAKSQTWSAGEPAADDLSQLSFFDRACREVYISRETEAAFRPFGLGLFDELVSVCERVRAEIDRRIGEAGRRTPGLPVLDEATEAGGFLRNLSARTRDDALTRAASFTGEDSERLAALERTDEQIMRGDPRIQAQRLDRVAERVERLHRRLGELGQTMSRTTWDKLIELRADRDTKEAAARLAREQAFSAASLGGVGDAAWRALWNAARAYSQVAYPEREFPVVEEALCVLCQQPVGDDAAERLRRFEEFIRETTQQAAQTAAEIFRSAVRDIEAAVVEDEASSDAVAEVRAENPELGEKIAAYLTEAKETQKRLAQVGHGDPSQQSTDAVPEPPTEELGQLAEALKGRALELVKSAEPERAAEVRAELDELRARKALADARETLSAEQARLRLVAKLNSAGRQCSTKAVTQKGAELTAKALTEVLVDRFTRETDRLGVEHVTLRTVGGRRGVLRYRTGFLNATQDAPLPEVLSEGEQTALGMAGFLAEIWTDPSKSGVILDDPISSLDHERRDNVAERLVALAEERQTIVFTHDIAFVLALKKHAVKSSVPVTERSVERLSARPGYCQDFHKFSAKLVKERLTELEERLAALRADRDSLMDEAYRESTAKWYTLLRRTWERAIEEALVGGVLTRDDLQVHPKMARTLVLFTAEDNKQLQHGYGRATELSQVHDESPLINAPPPSLRELADDLRLIRDWYKRIATRSGLKEEDIYARARTAQAMEQGAV